jgi:PleD family two-component response regulator
MSDERAEWISKRAYALWEEAGRPEGHDQEHWMTAVRERNWLERTKASLDGEEVLSRKRVVPLISPQTRPQRVLLVAKEAAGRNRTVAALQRAGIRAVEAGDAAQAMALLKNSRFDTVITGLTMPGHVDGFGLATCVRSLWPRTKVIILSGLGKMRKGELGPGVSFLSTSAPEARLIDAVKGKMGL